MTGHVIKYPLIMLVGGDKDEENQNCQSACKTSCTVGNQSCENN